MCVCVCVCVRERERERERAIVFFYLLCICSSHWAVMWDLWRGGGALRTLGGANSTCTHM